MTNPFDQRLRQAAREMPVPHAPPDLIARVIAERARGMRIGLPAERPSGGRQRAWVASTAVAASLVAIGLLATQRSAPRSTVDVRPPSIAGDSFSSMGSFFVNNAYAAQTSNRPTFPPLAMATPSLRAGAYHYRLQYVDAAGRVTPDRLGTVVIADASVGATAAWRVEHVTRSGVPGKTRVEAETLVVAKRDLRPISRIVSIRPYSRFRVLRIEQRFAADSVTGFLTADGGVRKEIARRLPPEYGPYLTDALAPFTLVGAALSEDWKASLSIVGWAAVSSDVFYAVSVRAIGAEVIETPVGRVDCWKIAVDAGVEHRIEWVRKSDGIGIRAYDQRNTPSGHRMYDLLNP